MRDFAIIIEFLKVYIHHCIHIYNYSIKFYLYYYE